MPIICWIRGSELGKAMLKSSLNYTISRMILDKSLWIQFTGLLGGKKCPSLQKKKKVE